MFSAFIRCLKMFSDDQRKFLDTLSTFSRCSANVLIMFSRFSQDLLGFLVLGCRVGFAGLIGWVGPDGLVGLLLNLTGLVGMVGLVGVVGAGGSRGSRGGCGCNGFSHLTHLLRF